MLYDFKQHIIELRNNEDKKKIVEEYEALYGKITGDVTTQIWYSEYIRRFVEKAPQIVIPDELNHKDFDWPLLVGLIAASPSNEKYAFIYPTKECVRPKEEKARLSISVKSGNGTITKTIDELWSFQIQRLYEIYIEEQLRCQILVSSKDADKSSEVFKSREQSYKDFSTALLYPSFMSPDQYSKKKIRKKQLFEPIPREKSVKIVYHYTNFDSFFHILTERSFRFSDSMRLNDKNEIYIYRSVLDEVLNWYRSATDYSNYKALLEKIRSNLTSFLKRECYISSFSNLHDSLDQWFKYGDFCKGICFGLEEGGWNPVSGLCKVFEDGIETIKKNNNFKLDKRDYGILSGDLEYSKTVIKNDVMKYTQTILEHYYDYRSKNTQNTLDSYLIQNKDFFESSCKHLLFRLIDLKDGSFESEKEVRYFWWVNSKNAEIIRKTFTSRGQYGHYISIPFDKLPLKEVWVGPMAPRETEFYVEKLLAECGYKDVKVIRSAIPLNI